VTIRRFPRLSACLWHARHTLFCFGIALLFAGLANGEAIASRSYHSWQWGGFSRSSAPFVSASSSASAFSLLTLNSSSLASAVSGIFSAAGVSTSSDGNSGLSGFVYYDQDGDGARTTDDWGIFEAVVQLTSETTGKTVSVQTAKNGSYSFQGLAAGNYTVTLLTPSTEPESPSIGTITNASNVTTVGSGVLVGTETIAAIQLNDADEAKSYDFPQLKYPTQLFSKRMLIDGDSGSNHTPDAPPPPVVPEPSSLVLLAVASLALIRFRFMRNS
jgi:hypothetical protein